MNAHEKQEVVKGLLRAEFRREQASDFELLRQIPSTEVRKFLDYFSTLDSAARDALSEAMGQVAFLTFSTNPLLFSKSLCFDARSS